MGERKTERVEGEQWWRRGKERGREGERVMQYCEVGNRYTLPLY